MTDAVRFSSIHEVILNSMGEAVYVTDRSMRIQYANPAAERLTGYTFDESVGRYCSTIFCEQSDLCAGNCPPKLAMSEKKAVLHRDALTKTKVGEVRETQISASPYTEDGECFGAVIVIKDVSDLKAAENRVRRQNLFLTSVIDALPHPFYVIDANSYRLLLVNKAASRSGRQDRTSCHEFSHDSPEPCSGADHPCPHREVKLTGKPVMVEHRYVLGNGSVRDMEVHGFPIFNDRGAIIQVIEYCIDITDRKRAAEERERLIAELQEALKEVKMLSGLLPVCSSCRKIKDEQGAWSSLESYISDHTEAQFSHGICPECAQKLYPDFYKKKSS
ncbi:MAG: PAS domain-containing protein [Nitrospiraceae bacterium]|nr:PAS domain-containing protein [Nitrospiraceae bacterium]